MKKKFGYLAVVTALLLIFMFGERATLAKLQFSASISGFFSSLRTDNKLKDRILELEKEIKDMKTGALAAQAPAKTVKVYSSYPFNNASEIAIAAGADAEVVENEVITYGKRLLVGKVKRVFSGYSVVTTLHDPGWEMAVRIGPYEVDGLFTGGNRLMVRLIPKNGEIKEGDLAVAASAGFPYGLNLGSIKTISEDSSTGFRTATLEPSVKLSELRNVSIYRK